MTTKQLRFLTKYPYLEVTRPVVEERKEYRQLVEEGRGRTKYDIKVFKRKENKKTGFYPTQPIGIRFL